MKTVENNTRKPLLFVCRKVEKKTKINYGDKVSFIHT